MAPSWTRLIRFIAEEDGQAHLGEVDTNQDVGLALLNKEKVTAKLVTGSIFDGAVTDKQLQVAQVGPHKPEVIRNVTFTNLTSPAPFPNRGGKCPHHPLHGPQLPRPRPGSQHAHPRRAGPLRQATDRSERALPGQDQRAQDCSGRVQ